MSKIIQGLIKRFFGLFLQAFINHISKNAFPEVLAIVNSVSAMNLSNPEKRTEAFKQISDFFKKTGRDVRDSAINAMIETAVLTLKGGEIRK
jgi:hypothetical protein